MEEPKIPYHGGNRVRRFEAQKYMRLMLSHMTLQLVAPESSLEFCGKYRLTSLRQRSPVDTFRLRGARDVRERDKEFAELGPIERQELIARWKVRSKRPVKSSIRYLLQHSCASSIFRDITLRVCPPWRVFRSIFHITLDRSSI